MYLFLTSGQGNSLEIESVSASYEWISRSSKFVHCSLVLPRYLTQAIMMKTSAKTASKSWFFGRKHNSLARVTTIYFLFTCKWTMRWWHYCDKLAALMWIYIELYLDQLFWCKWSRVNHVNGKNRMKVKWITSTLIK